MSKASVTLIFVFLLLVGNSISSSAQIIERQLEIADSLYLEKKFTESFEIYEAIHKISNLSSPQMLLKMAFIKEGLRDHGNALYYLNLYYLKTSDKKALRKMDELAKKHELKGYEYSDSEFFLMIYRKYNNQITYFLLALCLVLFAIIYRQKIKSENKPILKGVALGMVLTALFVHINFMDNYDKGIVLRENSYLMNSPSSGADLVAIIDRGHRVDVKKKQDVWVEIEWQGNKAFIRENNIATIE